MSDGWAELLDGGAQPAEVEQLEEVPDSTPPAAVDDDVPCTPQLVASMNTSEQALPPPAIHDLAVDLLASETPNIPRFEAELAQIVRNHLINGADGQLGRQARLYNQLRPLVRICHNLQAELHQTTSSPATAHNVLQSITLMQQAEAAVRALARDTVAVHDSALGKLLSDLTASFTHTITKQRLPAALADCFTKQSSGVDAWMDVQELLQQSASFIPLSSLLSSCAHTLVQSHGSQEEALVTLISALQAKQPIPDALVPPILSLVRLLFLPSPLPSSLLMASTPPSSPRTAPPPLSSYAPNNVHALYEYVDACTSCISYVCGHTTIQETTAEGGVLPSLLTAILTSLQQQPVEQVHHEPNVNTIVNGSPAINRLTKINDALVSLFGRQADIMPVFNEAYSELQLRYHIESYLQTIVTVVSEHTSIPLPGGVAAMIWRLYAGQGYAGGGR
jgi:hypothetical protein